MWKRPNEVFGQGKFAVFDKAKIANSIMNVIEYKINGNDFFYILDLFASQTNEEKSLI